MMRMVKSEKGFGNPEVGIAAGTGGGRGGGRESGGKGSRTHICVFFSFCFKNEWLRGLQYFFRFLFFFSFDFVIFFSFFFNLRIRCDENCLSF